MSDIALCHGDARLPQWCHRDKRHRSAERGNLPIMIQADCLHSLANVANQFVDPATHVPERAKGLFKVTCEPLPTLCDAVVQRVRRKGKTAPTNELGIETRQFMQNVEGFVSCEPDARSACLSTLHQFQRGLEVFCQSVEILYLEYDYFRLPPYISLCGLGSGIGEAGILW